MSEKSDRTLEIKVSRVLALAEKCPDWKAGLKEMFPDAFKDDKYFDLGEDLEDIYNKSGSEAHIWITRDGKSFCFGSLTNWKHEEDKDGFHCMTPTRKS